MKKETKRANSTIFWLLIMIVLLLIIAFGITLLTKNTETSAGSNNIEASDNNSESIAESETYETEPSAEPETEPLAELNIYDSEIYSDTALLINLNGWDTLKAIRKNGKTKHLPVIMLTAVNEDQKMVTGLKIGADDYIVKPFVLPNLLARMEAVLRRSIRQKEISQDVIQSQVPIDLLTSKEKEVLQMVAKGESNKQIADKMFVKEVTVKTHLNSIFKKLKVANRTQAVLLAMQADLVKN